jgi:4-hydroxybenzoate polyprenyltransferase
MVGARTAAMAYNRYADWDFDIQNPRTAGRHRLMSRRGAWGLTVIGVGVFLMGAWSLNRLCFLLSPLALVLILGYSLAKRFTLLAHAILGLALAAAPMGAWAAVRGSLWDGMEPWLLALATALWVFGFDLIYATLDTDFDRRAGLHSIPAKLGERTALAWARWLHGGAWIALGAWAGAAGFGPPEWTIWGIIGGVLVWEHRQARPGDAEAVNRAFFLANAVVSGLVLLQCMVHLWK